MNTLIEKGLLNEYWNLGSPVLVTVWTGMVIFIYFLTRKKNTNSQKIKLPPTRVLSQAD